MEHDRLFLPPNTQTQTMYFLPKAHKVPMKLQPIVSCTNGPTCKASAYLDRLLQPHMWGYIDDVFMIWPHSISEFDSFLKELNTRQERIRFMAEINTQACNFLDLTIYKSPTFLSTRLLSTKMYYKSTNNFAFPLGSSYMPTQRHRSIAISEITRLLKNTDDPSLFWYYQNKLIKKFAQRGYPKRILWKLWSINHDKRQWALYRTKRQRCIQKPVYCSLPHTRDTNFL